MSRLLDSSGFQYNVVMNDRPTFRFGDGLTLKATSRVDLTTTALGVLKIYVLDGTGEQTPLLIGARDLFDRRASIDYEALVLCWRDDIDRDWVSPLFRLDSGHLSIELGRKPRRYHRLPPPDGHDGRGPPPDDGGDGGEDDGHGDGNGRPPKVIRRQAPTNVRGYGDNTHPLRPPHRQADTSPSDPMEELTEDGEGGEEEDEEPDSPMPTAEEIEAADRRAEEWIRNKDAKDRAAAAKGALPKRAPAPNTPYSPSEETVEDEDKHDHDGEEVNLVSRKMLHTPFLWFNMFL